MVAIHGPAGRATHKGFVPSNRFQLTEVTCGVGLAMAQR